MNTFSLRTSHVLLGALVLLIAVCSAQANPYRGLWVGEAVLGAVNEVSVPLDASNVPRAPDPNEMTPTSDVASLRLILHVDASGRVSLLKRVAILGRKADAQETESDLALVTDERLYGAFPPQAATRISSVAFDFGDAKATTAVDEVVKRVAAAAASEAQKAGATKETIAAAAIAAAEPVIEEANASAAFAAFLQAHLDAGVVKAIAGGASTSGVRDEAVALETNSFFADARGNEMLDAIETAVAAAPVGEEEQIALNTAATFVETEPNYDRFLAGEVLGDAISAAAEAAVEAAAGIGFVPVASFEELDGGAAVKVVSGAHGLAGSAEVVLRGAAVGAYNGLHGVVLIDDDSFRIEVEHVAGGTIAGYSAAAAVAPLQVYSPEHGLESGDVVQIRDSLPSYDGRHLVTLVDEDTFSVDVAFESDPSSRGFWYSRSGEIGGYEAAPDGSTGFKVIAPGHGLNNGQIVEIRGSEEPSYNVRKPITRINADSFSIDQAFAGNPDDAGTWELAVPISGFAPPPGLSALVESPAHGLASGDRVIISGSGKADYNGEFAVTVFNADTFSIPVEFDDDDGNPAMAGAWQPGAGGEWMNTEDIRGQLDTTPKVDEAINAASDATIDDYEDSRAEDALDLVIDAIVEAAAMTDSALTLQATALAVEAGRDALAESVARYPRPSIVPSTDYDSFVRSQEFADSVGVASAAAAAAAIKEKKELLATPSSIRDKAQAAAIDALAPVFAQASRALLPELPMDGGFGPDGGGLGTELVLPANHPTNPFRHRRHPDHTVGIEIRRSVNLSFDAEDAQPLAPAGYGVERINGIYEEEIKGLHKLLGPDKKIGLKVRGSFQLNRISTIDTLNGL